jgi:DNA-binding protein HU-beta
MPTINKSQFVEHLAAKCGITVSAAEHFVNVMFGLIYEYTAKGDKVNFSGFGHFSVSHRNARLGVNPRTLEKITIPELNTPKFKAGETFKQEVALKK